MLVHMTECIVCLLQLRCAAKLARSYDWRKRERYVAGPWYSVPKRTMTFWNILVPSRFRTSNSGHNRSAVGFSKRRSPMPDRTELKNKRAASLRFETVKPGLAVPAVFWTTDAQLRIASVQGNGLDVLGITSDDL